MSSIFKPNEDVEKYVKPKEEEAAPAPLADTPNLGLKKPNIGGDADTWGDIVNDNYDVIDAKVATKQAMDAANAAQDAVIATKANTTDVNTALATKAPLNGAALTNPTANTPAAGDSSGKLATTAFVQSALGGAVPPGTIVWYAMPSPPPGYLKANGAWVSRTTYAALFAAISTYWGAGDGSGTFALPDLRGEFIRSWDDGRGVDPGRGFGDVQLDQMQRIQGTFNASPYTQGRSGAFTGYTASSSVGTGSGTRGTYTFDSGGSPNARVSADSAGETRPRNITLLACIKY